MERERQKEKEILQNSTDKNCKMKPNVARLTLQSNTKMCLWILFWETFEYGWMLPDFDFSQTENHNHLSLLLIHFYFRSNKKKQWCAGERIARNIQSAECWQYVFVWSKMLEVEYCLESRENRWITQSNDIQYLLKFFKRKFPSRMYKSKYDFRFKWASLLFNVIDMSTAHTTKKCFISANLCYDECWCFTLIFNRNAQKC